MAHRHAVPGGIALLVAACGLSVTGVDPVDAGALVEASAAPLIDSGVDAVAPASDATAADVAVDTGPLCDAPSLDCCGTGPCPAGTTECINGACFVSVDIAARIDGYDDLRLKGHRSRPTRHPVSSGPPVTVSGSEREPTLPVAPVSSLAVTPTDPAPAPEASAAATAQPTPPGPPPSSSGGGPAGVESFGFEG